MSKPLLFSDDARAALLREVNIMSRAVKVNGGAHSSSSGQALASSGLEPRDTQGRNSLPSWSIDYISAVTLAVRDMAESVAFYQQLGFDVSYGGPDASFTTMRAGQSVINLRKAATTAGTAWTRVILRVRGVDRLRRDLVAKGLAPTAPRDAEWGERYFELPDPQGVVISFAESLIGETPVDAARRPPSCSAGQTERDDS